MKVDLSCPLEMRGYELIHDDAGHTRALVRLSNLSGRRIAALEAVADWSAQASGAAAARPFRAERLAENADGCITLSLSSDSVWGADRLALHFSRVRFVDGSADWRAGSGQVVDVGEAPVLPGEERNILDFLAGPDAQIYAEMGIDTWICVCGRTNERDRKYCVRCGRVREEVLSKYTKSAVEMARAHGAVDESAIREVPLDDTPLDVRKKQQLSRRKRMRCQHARRLLLLKTAFGMTALAMLLAALTMVR